MPPLRLEEFLEDAPLAAEGAEAGLDPLAQQGYEAGYQAGWEDALAARDRDADEAAAEVTRALQGMEFTFHDARAHVLRGLAPLFTDLAARLLPKIALASLPQLISEALLPLAEQASDTPVEILVPPALRARVEGHLASLPSLPVVLIDQPDLPPARIVLRLAERETRIDVQAALDAIDTLLRSYFEPSSQDARYG